jgi:putative hydrolase of the HAD superfamily
MLRAVTFDFWNTLFIDTHGRERERRRVQLLLEELGQNGRAAPAATVVEEALRTGLGFFDRVWYEEHRTPLCHEIVDSALAALHRTLPAPSHARVVKEFEEMILDSPPEPTAGAREILAILAERYRLAVICDTAYSPGAVLRDLMAHHDMLEYFQYLFFSDEHGMCKPDPRVFRRTLSELDVAPRDAAHVGDIQRTDIAGAQATGMAAVHFIGANDYDAAHSTAEAVLSSLEELPATLDGLRRPRLRLASPLIRRRRKGQ